MSSSRTILASLAVAALLASPLAAQNRAAYVFVKGGGINDLTSLNDAGSLDLKGTGYTLSGGAAMQVQKYVVLRGDFTFAQSGLQQNSLSTGTDVNRFFYDGAVQLQYPTASGVMPYVFAGGGAVTLHQVGTSGDDATKGTFTYGAGLNYVVPRTGLQLFVEGKSWVYDPKNMSGALAGVDKWQNDLAWSMGVAYRFPF